jgi:Fur family ferric uptake transcriptional regulator
MKNDKNSSQNSQQILKQFDLKATQQRIALLDFLFLHHGPFTVDEIFKSLKSETTDLATIYRNIAHFDEKGIVSKCFLGDGQIRYEISDNLHCHDHDHHSSHHHHHLICRQCKMIVSIDLCLPEQMTKEIEKLGYSQVQHQLEFSGLCPKCQ